MAVFSHVRLYKGEMSLDRRHCSRTPTQRRLQSPNTALQSDIAATSRPQQCVLPVRRSLANQTMHDAGGGKVVVPLLQPEADALPFAVALELHRRTTSPGAEPAACSSSNDQQSSYQLHYVLQGEAQLVQDGQRVGEVRAGDSLLMSSGAAQCRAYGSGDRGGGRPCDDPTWQLAAITLVLGVHQDSSSDSDGDSSLSMGEQAAIDTAAAQQVANEWQAFPVVGMLSPDTVQKIMACAQQTAQQAVTNSQEQHQHQKQSPARLHVDVLHDDSGTASTETAVARSAAIAASVPHSHPNAALASKSGSGDRGIRTLRGDAAAAWAALSGSLLQCISPQLTLVLQRMRGQQALHHLEASLASSNIAAQAVQRRRLRDLLAYKLPGQTNQLALVWNPLDDVGVPFTFGLEIFERNHRTPPHVHETAHELFFILSGSGTAFCDGQRFTISAGDIVVFPPTSVHGIDNGASEKLFCLELMLPNEMFAEFVKRGLLQGGLSKEDLCTLIAEECGYVQRRQ